MQSAHSNNIGWHRIAALVCSSALGVAFFISVGGVALAATVRLAPSDTTIEAGDTVSVRISLTSEDQAVNAVSGIVNFPSNLLELVSLSKSASIIGLWVQEPSFSNAGGNLHFEGVILNPGFTGSGGTILTAKFRALKAGSANLTLSQVQALANDGSGTDILSGSSGTAITIAPPSVKEAKPTPAPAPQPEIPAPTETQVVVPVPTPAPQLQPTQQGPSWWGGVFAWARTLNMVLLLALLILLILAVLIFEYIRLKKELRHELHTVDETLHRALVLLRDEVEEFVEALEKEKTKRKLTLLEGRFVKQMKQNLADTEKVMKRVIRNAEDKL